MTSLNSTSNRIIRHLTKTGLSILTVSALVACGHTEDAATPRPQVSAAPALVKKVSQWDEFNGRVEAVQSVELRPRVSGYLNQVNYVEGQEVKKGDVLFTIDARRYQAEYDRASAALARARTQAVLARTEAERASRLSEQKAISTEAREQRRAAADQAGADVVAAQATLDLAALNLGFTKVRAPIDGLAGRAMVTVGNLVTADDTASVLTTLVSLNTVYVYFDADEDNYLRYTRMARSRERPSDRQSALPVKIALSGEEGFPHDGKVDFLDNQVARSTGTIRVRALVNNRDRQFTPGLFARVQLLVSGQFDAVLIDEKAVLTDQDRKYVYVVDKAGIAQRHDIQLGGNAEELLIVKKGLAAGDRVIVDGLQKVLASGTPVNAEIVPMQLPPDAKQAPTPLN